MDLIGMAIVIGMCLAFGVAALVLALGGIFIDGSRALLEGLFARLMWALRPLLLTGAVISLLLFSFLLLAMRQAWFLDEPLFFAASKGDAAEVRSLLDRGASPDAWFEGRSALARAAAYGHREVVILLLCEGADRIVTDNEGKLAVELALENGYLEVAELLQVYPPRFCN